MNVRKVRLTAAILSLLATSAGAQETFELDDIIISGGNNPVSSAHIATSHSIISQQDIVEATDKNIAQLLRAIPGLNVSSTAAPPTKSE